MILKRSSPRDCKKTFVIGRGYAEVPGQFVKLCVPGQFAKNAYNSSNVWNLLIKLCIHIDIEDLSQGIAKWH